MEKADNFNPGKWLVENKITFQSRLNENEENLLDFVTQNKEQIAKLNTDFEEIIMGSDVEKLSPNLWSEEDFDSMYEDYSYQDFMNDWKKYNPQIIMLGEELSTVFVTDKPLPDMFANTITGNDAIFFGTIERKGNAFKKYNVNNKTLYIVWGIPDPGS